LKDEATHAIFMFDWGLHLPSGFIRCFLQDRGGVLWIGTNNGLCRFNGEYLETFTTAQGLGGNLIVDLLEDRLGRIWVYRAQPGGFEGGMDLIDLKAGVVKHLKEELLFNTGQAMCEDGQGRIWVRRIGGLRVIDDRAGLSRRLDTAQGLDGANVSAILQDKHGQLWVGYHDKAVDVIDPKAGRIKHLSKAKGFIGDIHAMAEDSRGRIWLSTGPGRRIMEGSDVYLVNEKRTGLKKVSIRQSFGIKQINILRREVRDRCGLAPRTRVC
jgi:ligand-binding sensor domain-containing protein